jgi:hypothetical protein
VWAGWPGLFVDDPAEQAHVTEQPPADSMAPVFLTAAEIHHFYEGFSNGTLWPTCHYFSEFAAYEQSPWKTLCHAAARGLYREGGPRPALAGPLRGSQRSRGTSAAAEPVIMSFAAAG